MEINELFVTASRNKFRFPFRGMVSAEDLWDLTTSQLDSVFKVLNSQKKIFAEESLMRPSATDKDNELDAKIDIVRYVFAVKLKEQEDRNKEKEKAQKRQKILSLMVEKDNEELRTKTKDELAAMLDQL